MSSLLRYLSFGGRANRQRYWLTNITLGVFFLLGVLVVGGFAELFWPIGLIAVPFFVVFFIASLAICARRLHDRDKSAWWLLLFQGVPLLLALLRGIAMAGGAPGETVGAGLAILSFPISIWAFVELACLKGTTGPNKYGPDPLAPAMEEVFA
jgi:uncharacterized membrane protein YhaH (DUF805 family)